MTQRIGLALAMALTATVAVAQEPALRTLETQARLAPSDGGAAIELANAYWRAGQTTQADGAYRRALALDNVMLETRDGDAVWSHEVAERMLAKKVALTSR